MGRLADKMHEMKDELYNNICVIVKKRTLEDNVIVIPKEDMYDLAVGVPFRGVYPYACAIGYSKTLGVKIYLRFNGDERPSWGNYQEAYPYHEDKFGTFAYMYSHIFSVESLVNIYEYLAERFGDEEETDTERHPLVGRRMIVGDNHHNRELETGAKGYLVGAEVIILCAPYLKEDKKGKKRYFVRVHALESGFDYEVPFKDEWLIKELSY